MDASELPEEARALWESLSDVCSPTCYGISWGGVPCFAVIREAAGSQFDALLAALEEGADLPNGAGAVALEGRGFHGQRGRSWEAARGNLHFCMVFDCGKPASHLGVGLTMLPAVAAAEAVSDVLGPGVDVGIKWVNDIEIDRKKVGGVITSTIVKGAIIEKVVVGIGINVTAVPEVVPTSFVPAVDCLRNQPGGEGASWWGVTGRLVAILGRLYNELLEKGPGPLLEAYRERCSVIGAEVAIWDDSHGEDGERTCLAEGRLSAVHEDLSLQLEGTDEPVTRGRLTRL